MSFRGFYIASFIVFVSSFEVFSQETNKKCKWVKDFDQPIELDSLSLFSKSLTFTNIADSLVNFEYDINTNRIVISPNITLDSIQVCYQVFPLRFDKRHFNRDMHLYDSNAFFEDKPLVKGISFEQKEELFATPSINKSGSISRGISFGNTQNVFVNSSLNLQLDGKLTDDVNIRAVITDQNIPFQPEGNTQQLQEFDKVFIELYGKKGSLAVGDVILKNEPSYFLKYNRNVQGGKFKLNYKLSDKSAAETSFGIAVAKGKFASTNLQVSEGVQGPYQLKGPNNERFIIILANSEKVFLDGKLLSRGFNYDYVIDYNLAEITFTNKVLITKFSRLRIDFEFSDRNYSRTVMAAAHKQSVGNLDFFVSAYSEKDNKNRPLTFNLTNEEKQLFSEQGDELPLVIQNRSDSVIFNENIVQYKKIDTLDDSNIDTKIFKFSSNADSAFYIVNFTEVGVGNGSYILKNTTINGRVFEWVSPIGGIAQGNYDPVTILPAPNKKQVITLGASYEIKKAGKIFSEFAFSDNDLNLYSTADAQNNKGNAFRVGFESVKKPIKFLNDYRWSTNASFEFNNEHYQAIDRFRYVEYDRDWGVVQSTENQLNDDHIFQISTILEKDNENNFEYKLVRRNKGNQLNGYQHFARVNKSFAKLQLQANLFLMNNQMQILNANWQKLNTDISWKNKRLIPGYHYQVERNETSTAKNDSIVSTVMNFESHTFYLKSSDSLKTSFNADFTIREDQSPVDGEFVKSNYSETTNIRLNTVLKKDHRINATFTYRTIDNFLVTNEPKTEETIMGRIDYRGNLFDKILTTKLTYAIGNGRELKREFVYLPVPTGEGTHTWRDDNNDGVQDLEEFFEAINADERNYIKVFVPTDEFIQAFSNNVNYRIDIKFPSEWRASSGFKKAISRFSNTTSIKSLQKFTESDLSTRFFSFTKNIKDDQLISTRETVRSVLFYNKGQRKFGFDITYLSNVRKQLLTRGFESRNTSEYNLNIRFNIKRLWDLKLFASKGEKSNGSDFLADRNFFIKSTKFSPEIFWQPNRNFRFGAAYVISQNENVMRKDIPESSEINEVILKLRFSKVSKSNLNASMRLIDINFKGQENSAVGYELLNALRPGKNLTWGINWQQKLIGGLQLGLNYEGRKSPDQATIHIGRMQVSALF